MYIDSSYLDVSALPIIPVYTWILFPASFHPLRVYWLCPSHPYIKGTSAIHTSGPAYPVTLFLGLFSPVRGY